MNEWAELFRGAGVALTQQDLELRHTAVFDEGGLLGVAALIGQRDDAWLPPVEAARVSGVKRLVIETGVTRTCHVVRGSGDASRATAVTATVRRDDAGAVKGILSLVTDLGPLPTGTDVDSLARLASGIAHEFNNQLTVIVGYTEMLRERERSGPEIDAIGAAARRASNVSRQLLAFGRRQAMVPEAVAIDSLLRGHARTMRRVLGLSLDVQIESADDPLWVLVDVGQMERVVMNLVLHLRTVAPNGGPVALVARSTTHAFPGATESGTASAEIEIRAADVSVGATDRARVFEPYFTGGLGLAEAHGLVTQMGGDIALASSATSGTAFRIWLPLIPRPADAAPMPSAAETGATVLVVEPDAAVREFATRTFKRQGHTVIEAVDRADVLKGLADSSVHLVLAEVAVWCAGDAGLSAEASRLRPDLPVLLMTGHAEALLQGPVAAAAFLRKPFTPADLIEKASRLLRPVRQA